MQKLLNDIIEAIENTQGLSNPKKIDLSNQVRNLFFNFASSKLKKSIQIPKIDETTGKEQYFCRWHNRYENKEDMIFYKDKSKGYCRAGLARWNETQREINKLEIKALEAFKAGLNDEALKYSNEATQLKIIWNTPDNFDYDRDWDAYHKNTRHTKKTNSTQQKRHKKH
ncbi:hypothetical protein CCY99_08880 [Helicobacter sp. 16-1353]|uniref:hypothetical protein n=1 Tax=Helicobacter sp. 16-1353 TaxID=2004996 RepID=UPI000DCC8F77|nr:hypothetical protein [Helicobacter sp. 16-1353]RAX51565.1 hypothetical protein CCY99_08880 [Helicobacter sp. 16-1353]